MPFVRGPYAAPAMLAMPAFSAHPVRFGEFASSISREDVQPRSEWQKVGEDTSRTQQALGHASLATTGRYLHARPTDSSARYLGV
jgi:hypothetical protein